jgi:hypothetical protein
MQTITDQLRTITYDLRPAEFAVLFDALTHFDRLVVDGPGPEQKNTLAEQWIGLGKADKFGPAVEAGYMIRVNNRGPDGYSWHTLTPKGIAIVLAWFAAGWRNWHSDTDQRPPLYCNGMVPMANGCLSATPRRLFRAETLAGSVTHEAFGVYCRLFDGLTPETGHRVPQWLNVGEVSVVVDKDGEQAVIRRIL